MKKLIDIPDKLIPKLKILAVKENRSLKSFIESQIIKVAEKAKKEKAS